MSLSLSIGKISYFDRKTRFAQVNSILPELFSETNTLNPSSVQLVTTSGAYYLLDMKNEGNSPSRRVIVSSDGKSRYHVGMDYPFLKPKKLGNGIRIRRIFDISQNTLEAALAIVVACRYPQLREELIKRDMPRDGINDTDWVPMGDRELLSKFGFTI